MAPMPPIARGFDAELAQLEQLRGSSPALAEPALRKALTHSNNFLVAKAAKLVLHFQLKQLTPQLVQAFPRFLQNSSKTDPQCWAKVAIVEALSHFEHQEPELFLAGLHHFQPEGTWGGQSDSAGQLRALCCLGLVQCRGLSNHQVLGHLVPLFADKELAVRVAAARAVEQVGTDSAVLLLRLRAELASDEPELLGACYSGVLRLEGEQAIPWAAKFLNPSAPDDASTEAAFAIAETRTQAAFTTLKSTWTITTNPDFRRSLLLAIGLTRQEPAYEFLLEKAADGNRDARHALEQCAPPQSVLNQLRNPTP